MKTIGVLGGMGPEATNQLCAAITAATPATKDQDHIAVLSFSNPAIPDRTQALLHGGPSPLPELIKTGHCLQMAGADFLVIPCNTAHCFYDELVAALAIPVLHMIEETAQFIRNTLPDARKIGLLATSGTVKTGIYARFFENYGLETLEPNDDEQEALVMKAIYGEQGIKAGFKDVPNQLLAQAAMCLETRGAQAIVAGCTEIPLVMTDTDVSVPFINPTQILAQAAVRRARMDAV